MSFDPKAFLQQIEDEGAQVPRRDLTNNLRHIHIDKDKDDGGDGPFQGFRTSWMRKPTDKLKQLFIDRLGAEPKKEEKKTTKTAEAAPEDKPKRRGGRRKKAEETEGKTEAPKRRRKAAEKTTEPAEKPAEKTPEGSGMEDAVYKIGDLAEEQKAEIIKLQKAVAKLAKTLKSQDEMLKCLGDVTDLLKVLVVDLRVGAVGPYGGDETENPSDYTKDELVIATVEDLKLKGVLGNE